MAKAGLEEVGVGACRCTPVMEGHAGTPRELTALLTLPAPHLRAGQLLSGAELPKAGGAGAGDQLTMPGLRALCSSLGLCSTPLSPPAKPPPPINPQPRLETLNCLQLL